MMSGSIGNRHTWQAYARGDRRSVANTLTRTSILSSVKPSASAIASWLTPEHGDGVALLVPAFDLSGRPAAAELARVSVWIG